MIDVETTGLSAPITVVELAAQRMRGWEPYGAPFRRLLNQNADISPEASRVNGYTREILERDGEPALDVYRDFAVYAEKLPIVSYNLQYDLHDVLRPEWKRLDIREIGSEGFCALKLAQRLLDPVPAGNCKLQTLRQFYRLPERGAHTALGDVETVVDLMTSVLRPLAEARGIFSWDDILAFVAEEWFPSRIAFGKFKGRDFRDAAEDPALRGWLTWLAAAENARSAAMGRWYLARLEEAPENLSIPFSDLASPEAFEPEFSAAEQNALVRWRNPETERLQAMIAFERSRLAELQAAYTSDRRAVDHVQAQLFTLVRTEYQARDRLRLIVDYRRRFIDTLIAEGAEEADNVSAEYAQARANSDDSYEQASAAAAGKKTLSDDDKAELDRTWKKLVKLFHPDRFAHDAEKRAAYENLMAAINHARDEGNIALLREIADDPNAYMLRQGWRGFDVEKEAELKSLQKLLAALQLEVVNLLELSGQLRESPEYELLTLSKRSAKFIEEIAGRQKQALAEEIEILEAEAARLKDEIEALTGEEAAEIG